MATEITVRQNSGSRGAGIVVIRSDDAGGLELNTNAGKEGANATSNETVSAMTISHIAWTDGWTISRGANVVWQTPVGSWGQYDFADEQLKLEHNFLEESANLTFANTAGGSAASLVIKMHKRSGVA